jgi:hypothetical protein
MPELCRFFGIVIRMYAGDHPPPHFHAEYAEHEVQISIGDRRVMRGSLPPRQSKLVMEWAAEREADLLAAWARASADETPGTIDPL